MTVVILTTGLVPKTGMKKEYINLSMPDANPGIAASQKSSMVVNLKPMAGSLTTTALMTNHVANEKIRLNVVTAPLFLNLLELPYRVGSGLSRSVPPYDLIGPEHVLDGPYESQEVHKTRERNEDY